MGYTVFGEPNSGSFMVEAALAEAGQPYDVVDLDLKLARPAEYLALNPSGKIPALRFPDGTVMAQSAAILMALAERYPHARLLPEPDAPDRRAALHWLIFIVAEIYPLIELEDYPTRFVGDGVDVAPLKAHAVTRMRERWLMVEAVAPGARHFLPSGFSALDLMIGMVSHWLIGRDWRKAHCPKLDGIHATVIQRPAIAPVWARHAVG